RMRRERHLLERPVAEIGREHGREREKRGEHRAHPDHAGSDAPQELGVGADAERKERGDEDEECDHEERLARMAPRDPHVAAEGPRESRAEGWARCAHAPIFRTRVGVAARSWWVATTASPPAARWRSNRRVKSA